MIPVYRSLFEGYLLRRIKYCGIVSSQMGQYRFFVPVAPIAIQIAVIFAE